MHPKKKKANVKFNGIWLSSEESMSVYFAGNQFVERRCKTSVIATALFWHTAQSVFIHMFVFNFYDSHPSAWVEIIKERSEWSVCGNIIIRRRRRRTLMLEVFDVVSASFVRLCVISVHIAGPWPAESDIKCDGVAKHIPIIAWISDAYKGSVSGCANKELSPPPTPTLVFHDKASGDLVYGLWSTTESGRDGTFESVCTCFIVHGLSQIYSGICL